MNARSILWLPLLAICGCSLFGGVERQQPLERLEVVDSDRPFRPEQAVDDDDDEVVGGTEAGDDPEDAAAFSEVATQPLDRPAHASEPPKIDEGRVDARSGADGSPDASTGLPSERTATATEVEARVAKRRATFEQVRAQGGDREAKTQLARNPAPTSVAPHTDSSWTLQDWLLESLLLAVAAAVVGGAMVLAARFPKVAVLTATASGLLGGAWLITQLD
ncbi:MAG: hypothetical protein ACE37K_18355 [Planctomycetota bacterium]